MKKFLIILRGAPATSKSTIAKKLCDFKKRIIWLKVDFFKRIFDTDKYPEALDIANLAALNTLQFLLKNNFSVVMEGVFQNVEHVETAQEIAKESNANCHVFELTGLAEILDTRDQNREEVKNGFRRPLGIKTLAFLAEKIKNFPCENAVRLDTGNLSIDECLLKIKRVAEIYH